MTVVKNPILIDKVTVQKGAPVDNHVLKGTFFQPTGVHDTYLFYYPDGEQIQTDPPVIAGDIEFTFKLKDMKDIIWTISKLAINDEFAIGSWSNSRNTNDDDGTFQAQAGPSLGEEEAASSASA
jgi:hypothetical protein